MDINKLINNEAQGAESHAQSIHIVERSEKEMDASARKINAEATKIEQET